MLAALPTFVQAANMTLLAAGTLILIGWCVRWVRRGGCRDPLGDRIVPEHSPGLAGLGAAILAFLAIQLVAAHVIFPGGVPSPTPPPGSDPWHRMQTVEGIASLMAATVWAALLIRSRSLPDRSNARSSRRSLLAALAVLLVLIPVLTVQYQAGQWVLLRLYPDQTPPIHVVLRALHQSAWGMHGVVQLCVGAVVIAPLAEELFFRGVLLQTLWVSLGGRWLPIGVSAVLFGLVHVAQPQDVVPLVTMGVLLGALRLYTGRLWPCVLVHMLFNARTMTAALVTPELVGG